MSNVRLHQNLATDTPTYHLPMNWFLASAGGLAFATRLAHSVLGERLIFRRMRVTGFIPTNGGQVLREPHVRILWASWHLVTAMGWGFAAVLLWLARSGNPQPVIALAVALSVLASSMLVLVGTNGRHPGWVALLGVAALTAIGSYS